MSPSNADVAAFLRSEAASQRDAGRLLGIAFLRREGYPDLHDVSPEEMDAVAAALETMEPNAPWHPVGSWR